MMAASSLAFFATAKLQTPPRPENEGEAIMSRQAALSRVVTREQDDRNGNDGKLFGIFKGSVATDRRSRGNALRIGTRDRLANHRADDRR